MRERLFVIYESQFGGCVLADNPNLRSRVLGTRRFPLPTFRVWGKPSPVRGPADLPGATRRMSGLTNDHLTPRLVSIEFLDCLMMNNLYVAWFLVVLRLPVWYPLDAPHHGR